MRQPLKKRRGIILISVMFIAILVGMHAASATALNRGHLLATQQSAEDRLCEDAALSGLQYALVRLEESPEWPG